MKRAELFHPRVFDDQTWAEGYYQRNKKNIARVGKRLAKLLTDKDLKNARILDVGCGFASVPIEMARVIPDANIIGIDPGEPLLNIGRELIAKAGYSNCIKLKSGDAHHLDFKDNTFDVVINTFLLHIIEDPVQMLNEIERVTKPEGYILITDLRRGFLAYFIRKFRTAYTSFEAKQVIEQSGIRHGKMTNGPFWWDYMVLNESNLICEEAV